MTGAQLFWTFQCAKTSTNILDKFIGGVINLAWAGDFLILEVSPNTLTEDTIITLSNPFPIPNPTGVPSGFLPISEAVSIEPFDTELLQSVFVDMPYTDGEIKGYDEANLVAMEYDPTFDDWDAISSFALVDENLLLFEPVNFGIYGFTSMPSAPACDDGVDTDGDGVPDGCDSCPQDNPDDRDGDGICQSDDQCPDDPLNQCTPGSECTLSPTEVKLTLDKGESSEVISKVIDCDSDILTDDADPSDCQNKGIDVNIFNFQTPNPSEIDFNERFTNTGGAPGQTHCEVTFLVEFENNDPNVLLIQEVWITTPGPTVVGGELIPIQTTSLILAGAQSFSWMIPVILSVLGIGLFVFRKSKNS